MDTTPETATKRAIALLGGARAAAEKFGLTTQAIYKWNRVPALKVLEIERATGVSRHELRPDIFGEQI